MMWRLAMGAVVAAALCGAARGQSTVDAILADPLLLSASPGDAGDNSIYATPPLPTADQGINLGGAHFDFDVDWANRYVYRGVDHNTVATHGNSLNLLFQGRMEFDLGKYPHPFVGIFTDIYDADPVSRFQEVRPYIGFEWNLRPFLVEMGQINYIYPERETFNEPEAYGKVTLDDSLIFGTEKPVASPYVMGANDYHHSGGWYVETGMHHDFAFEDFGLTVTPSVAVAWISGLKQQFVFINTVKSTGWQHLEAGLTATYGLNTLLNIPKRYGEFDVKGFVQYDDALNSKVTANNVVWAGVGISFKY